MLSFVKKSALTACAASCAFLSVGLLLAPTARAEIMIDSFLDTQPLEIDKNHVPSWISSSVTGSSNNILGSERDAKLEWITNPGKKAYMDINYENSGVLDFIQDPRVKSTLTLTYDGTSGDLSEDLTTYGNSFAIDVLFTDLPIDVEIKLVTGSGTGTANLTLPGGIPSLQKILVPFTDFVGANDPTDVTAIILEINKAGAAVGADLTLESFRVVPEPASWLMLGIAAVVGLGVRRWRK